MGSDLVVALGPATTDGVTLFAQNLALRPGQVPAVARLAGASYPPGEKVRTSSREILQVRQTAAVLGVRAAGTWGLCAGVNEHRVAAGYAPLTTRMGPSVGGLRGADLVRLTLERCRRAGHAVDRLAELLRGGGPGTPAEDVALLIADPDEAFLVETAGGHWACQEIRDSRAVGTRCGIRQDWDRLSPGLSAHAIARGWWPADGSKLDFAEAVAACPVGEDSALRRWGRATLLLEQQHGHVDLALVRRLLADHFEGTSFEADPSAAGDGPAPWCRHGGQRDGLTTGASLVVSLPADRREPAVAWLAFGPPCHTAYLPFFVDAPAPEGDEAGDALCRGWRRLADAVLGRPERMSRLREEVAELQGEIDRQTEDFVARARAGSGEEEWPRRAGRLTQAVIGRAAEFLAARAAVSSALRSAPAPVAGVSF